MARHLHFAAILLLFSIACHAHVHPARSILEKDELTHFMTKFGYMSSSGFSLNDVDGTDPLESAIKTFQLNYKLEPTGMLDAATKALMARPRCGHPDTGIFRHDEPNGGSAHHRVLREAKQQTTEMTKWPSSKRELSYSFNTRKLGKYKMEMVRRLFERVTAEWAHVSDFRFKEDGYFGDIVIAFYGRNDTEHGELCGEVNQFLGPNAVTMAHSGIDGYLKGGYCRFHVNAETPFTLLDEQPKPDQYDLQSTALHEMGHILGLGHTDDPKAVMYAYANLGEKVLNLTDTDIKMLRDHYATP